jgi:tRNA pseudouridine55 synthase
MDGFFVIDKPAGMTSHDVVSAVRRIVGQKKVGHTGTLDPFATGVLPVALGEGTKAIPFLDESVKEYRAIMRLGETTDTQDYTGSIIRRGDWQGLTSDAVESAVMSFLGKGTQVPPMYSAIKKDGIPLYKLARKGEEIHREPRNMEIYSLVIEHIALPEITFTVRCSRGVYVRTLANDMGDLLGSGAHLTALRRNASGNFLLGSAVSLDALALAGKEGRLSDFLISCHDALFHMQSLSLNNAGVARVHFGMPPDLADFIQIPDAGLLPGERVRLNVDNQLIAVAENGPNAWPGDGGKLRLLRVFNEH